MTPSAVLVLIKYFAYNFSVIYIDDDYGLFK